MKRIAGVSLLALVLSASLVDCSKKSGEEYDELYDTTAIVGAVKYIDTLPTNVALKHPGGLNVTEDFDRIKAALIANNPDITAGYNKLIANSHAQATYTPN
ncbi:MAG TPA: cell wall anchor protein, partial [Niastella sp.]